MPWIVVRDRVGQPIEATPCAKDCFDRLEGLVRLRRSKGFQVVRVSARIYEATSPSGEVEFLSVDDAAPDFRDHLEPPSAAAAALDVDGEDACFMGYFLLSFNARASPGGRSTSR